MFPPLLEPFYSLSSTRRCFGVTVYLPGPSPQISLLSREPWFLAVENAILTHQDLGAGSAPCYMGVGAPGSLCRQSWEIHGLQDAPHAHMWPSADLSIHVQSHEFTLIPQTSFQRHRGPRSLCCFHVYNSLLWQWETELSFSQYITYVFSPPSHGAMASLSCLPCLAPPSTIHLQQILGHGRRKGVRGSWICFELVIHSLGIK